MTEEDARKKWCPFARVVPQEADTYEMGPAGNRIQLQRDRKTVSSGAIKTAMCLASACMAWRVRRTGELRSPVYGGYCGLAGRPE